MKKCRNCKKETKKLYEISISISAPCWMSNGHLQVCKVCADKDWEIFFDSDKNYKRFGNVYCPANPPDKLIMTMEGWEPDTESCPRNCFDSDYAALSGCKCVECLSKKGKKGVYILRPFKYK